MVFGGASPSVWCIVFSVSGASPLATVGGLGEAPETLNTIHQTLGEAPLNTKH